MDFEAPKPIEPDYTQVDDDNTLNFVQNTRKAIVTNLMSRGVPEDNESRNTLLRTLEGMSSTAQGNKRLKKDAEITADNAKVQGLLMSIFGVIGANNPAMSGTPQQRNLISGDEVLVEGYTPNEGAKDIGIASDDYNSFSERKGMSR